MSNSRMQCKLTRLVLHYRMRFIQMADLLWPYKAGSGVSMQRSCCREIHTNFSTFIEYVIWFSGWKSALEVINGYTDRQTDRPNHSNPRCTCAPRVKHVFRNQCMSTCSAQIQVGSCKAQRSVWRHAYNSTASSTVMSMTLCKLGQVK